MRESALNFVCATGAGMNAPWTMLASTNSPRSAQMDDLGLSDASPIHGELKIITADGHDAGASMSCKSNAEHGLTAPRFTYWLTPSGQLIEEGKRYRMRWVERFRGVRYACLRGGNPTRYDLLRYQGKWEIDSEALDD